MEPFSDLMALLRPNAVISKSITGRGRWGVRYAPYNAPGFAIVLTGNAWLAIDGREFIPLDRGDFVLLPTSPAFALLSHKDAEWVAGQPSLTALRHGEPEGEPDFRMLGGTFKLHPVNASLLAGLLPEIVHIRATEGDTGRLSHLVDLIREEYATDRPGRDTILERYLEIMLVECMRWPGIAQATLPAGLLAGMRDPAMAGALRAMHADIRKSWSVAELGNLAGMSRSAFSARFHEVLGCAPMEYLSRWRMAIARDALSRGGKTLGRIAGEIGYESASAFSTAFRRRMGCSPGAFARASASNCQPSLLVSGRNSEGWEA